MLLSGAHKASDCHDRRLHNTQFSVAGQAGAVTQQEGYGSCDLNLSIGNKTASINVNKN